GVVHVYTHRFGAESPADSGAVTVRLSRVEGSAASGIGVVASVDAEGGAVPLDSGAVVVLGRGAAAGVLRTLAAGDTAEGRIELVPGVGQGGPAAEAVGGQRVLLRDGAVAPDIREGINPSFGERRHPRTAVGVTAEGRLLW